jgi:hypothetical protein
LRKVGTSVNNCRAKTKGPVWSLTNRARLTCECKCKTTGIYPAYINIAAVAR